MTAAHTEYMRTWRAEHRDAINAAARARYAERGPVPQSADSRAKALERGRSYRARPDVQARRAAYRLANPEKCRGDVARDRARSRAYYQAHPERWVEASRNRKRWLTIEGRAYSEYHQSNVRAARFGCVGRITPAELQAIVGPCAYCDGRQTGWDHVVPLSRGGANLPDNIVPSCIRCNLSKGTRTPDEWLAAGHLTGAAR